MMKQRVVSTALVRKGDKFLFAWQNGKSDTLILPGGKVELGESPEQALHREFHEETNITLKNVKLEHTDSADISGTHFVFIAFQAEYDAGEEKAADDLKELVWLKVDEFNQYPQSDLTIKFLKKLDMYHA